jgi:ferredoxin
MRISVEKDKCFSSGNCVFAVPEVFDQDDDGYGVALLATPPAELENKVREAARSCPSGAISLLED